MDRNERARQEFAAKSQQRQINQLMQSFAQAMASGQAAVRDRFGKSVDIGSRVLLRLPYDYIYNVTDVMPVLDPNTPPGMAKVRLTIDTLIQVPVNEAIPTMLVVGRWKDAQEPAEQAAEAQQPPIPPPPTDADYTGTTGEPHPDAIVTRGAEDEPMPDDATIELTDGERG